jgi:hypothetical protein
MSCLLFKTRLNSIGLPVPHRKHLASVCIYYLDETEVQQDGLLH